MVVENQGRLIACIRRLMGYRSRLRQDYRKNQKLVSYPDNIPSTIHLIPHGTNIPVPLPPNKLLKVSRYIKLTEGIFVDPDIRKLNQTQNVFDWISIWQLRRPIKCENEDKQQKGLPSAYVHYPVKVQA
ncbi:hypothetical protein TNCV_3499371 [Trichonephila clavipes]|nr:hypothetical protein TNCV_3499371 [Trichonephila clavipes]